MPRDRELAVDQATLCHMGTQLLPPQKEGTVAPHLSAHVYCGQTAGWIKMPLGTKVNLGQAILC